MSLFLKGEFLLSAGNLSNWKVECDALTDEDWTTLAHMAHTLLGLPAFHSVKHIPTGGMKLGAAMAKYIDPHGTCLLICDDVWTTGKSMMEMFDSNQHGETTMERITSVIGLVTFARSPVPPWAHAIWHLGDWRGKV